MRIGTQRPYPPTGLDSARWRDVPPRFVRFTELTTTQDGVYLHALLGNEPPRSGDDLPHVVVHEGTLYLEDGHTRVARDVLRGAAGTYVRVYEAKAVPLEYETSSEART